jgi:hypothetical protein
MPRAGSNTREADTASAPGWFPDGRLAELFIDSGKFGTAMQANADTAAILVSLLLQHGVAPDLILHSISGPIAIALRLFMDEAP